MTYKVQDNATGIFEQAHWLIDVYGADKTDAKIAVKAFLHSAELIVELEDELRVAVSNMDSLPEENRDAARILWKSMTTFMIANKIGVDTTAHVERAYEIAAKRDISPSLIEEDRPLDLTSFSQRVADTYRWFTEMRDGMIALTKDIQKDRAAFSAFNRAMDKREGKESLKDFDELKPSKKTTT